MKNLFPLLLIFIHSLNSLQKSRQLLEKGKETESKSEMTTNSKSSENASSEKSNTETPTRANEAYSEEGPKKEETEDNKKKSSIEKTPIAKIEMLEKSIQNDSETVEKKTVPMTQDEIILFNYNEAKKYLMKKKEIMFKNPISNILTTPNQLYTQNIINPLPIQKIYIPQTTTIGANQRIINLNPNQEVFNPSIKVFYETPGVINSNLIQEVYAPFTENNPKKIVQYYNIRNSTPSNEKIKNSYISQGYGNKDLNSGYKSSNYSNNYSSSSTGYLTSPSQKRGKIPRINNLDDISLSNLSKTKNNHRIKYKNHNRSRKVVLNSKKRKH